VYKQVKKNTSANTNKLFAAAQKKIFKGITSNVSYALHMSVGVDLQGWFWKSSGAM